MKKALRLFQEGLSFSIIRLALRELLKDGPGNFSDRGTSIHGNYFAAPVAKIVDCRHCSRLQIVINIVALVNRRLILIIGPGSEIAGAAYPAKCLAILCYGFDGVDKNVIGVVVILRA